MLPFLQLINLKGKPYSLEGFRPFVPMFKASPSRRTTWKTGRQLGKTTGLSAQALLQASLIPQLQILIVTPFYNQAHELAAHRINPMIADSPFVQSLLADDSKKLMEHSFKHGSRILISHILKNPLRVKGISADVLLVDESQDMDEQMMPTVYSCLDASSLGIYQFVGVPTTSSCFLMELWRDSSQAEWAVPCPSCGYWNIPSKDQDLFKMIGPKGPICAKCGSRVYPDSSKACFVHARPERRLKHAGYHVSQILLPMHYKYEHKWEELLEKQRILPEYQFVNNILGEDFDLGSRPLTLEDIKAACALPPLDYNQAKSRLSGYEFTALGVDWGGKGLAAGLSRTAIAVIGKPKGKLEFHLLWGKIFRLTVPPEMEIAEIERTFKDFRCGLLAHDMLAGPLYETYLRQQTSIPQQFIRGVAHEWISPAKAIIRRATSPLYPYGYYQLDKTRSILLMIMAIKRKKLLLPAYQSIEELASDLLACELSTSERASDVLLVRRAANESDDFAIALNLALQVVIWKYHAVEAILGGPPDLKTLLPEEGV